MQTLDTFQPPGAAFAILGHIGAEKIQAGTAAGH